MSDIKAIFDPPTLTFDIGLAGFDLESEVGLETAVMVSLFSDRRADPDDVPPGTANDRRGWWGDTYAEFALDKFGSRLWLMSREKQTSAALARISQYANEALSWFVQDGIARSVSVQAEIVRPEVLGFQVEIARATKPVTQYRFEAFWGGG